MMTALNQSSEVPISTFDPVVRMDDASELARLQGVGSVVYADPDADQEELQDVMRAFGAIEAEVDNDSSRLR